MLSLANSDPESRHERLSGFGGDTPATPNLFAQTRSLSGLTEGVTNVGLGGSSLVAIGSVPGRAQLEDIELRAVSNANESLKHCRQL